MEGPLHQSPFPMPPPPPAMVAGGGGGGREQCPRCASRDTKFCYYNNYNTAQPRHFCRACRRYWTLGGSLRNVPIGGSTRKRPRPHRRAAALALALSAINANVSSNEAPPPQQQEAAAAAPSLLWSALLGGAPVLEGRLGMGEHQIGGFGAAAGQVMWPAARVMEGETWKGGVAGGGVYSSSPAAVSLWQELAAVAPVDLATIGGVMRHGGG